MGTIIECTHGDEHKYEENACIVLSGDNDERRAEVDKRVLRQLGHDLGKENDCER